jgi:hypothetical protein
LVLLLVKVVDAAGDAFVTETLHRANVRKEA